MAYMIKIKLLYSDDILNLFELAFDRHFDMKIFCLINFCQVVQIFD